MKRWIVGLAGLFISSFAACQDAQTQSPDVPQLPTTVVSAEGTFTPDVSSFIIFKDRAFVIGEPILASAPRVLRAIWSPDGQFMAIQQLRSETNVSAVQSSTRDGRPVPSETYLSLYSLSSGKLAEIMRFDTTTSLGDIEWIPGSDKALVVVDQQNPSEDPRKPATGEEKVFIVDAAANSIKEFSPWGGFDKPRNVMIFPSPTLNYSFLRGTFEGDKSPRLVLMTSDELFVSIDLPTGVSNPFPMWSQDGATAYVTASKEALPSGHARVWYKASLINGRLSETTKPTAVYLGGEPPAGLITIRELDAESVNLKASRSIKALWLETLDPDSQNRLLLAADASNGQVNRTMDAASYIAQGSLFVRPITEVPKKVYQDALTAWNRTQAMMQAREAGLAAIMFASDNEDILPGAQDRLSEILGPYLRDSSALNGFTYTYPGGPIRAVSDPANTQLGYLDTGDGRAVVYIDGHVKWMPK